MLGLDQWITGEHFEDAPIFVACADCSEDLQGYHEQVAGVCKHCTDVREQVREADTDDPRWTPRFGTAEQALRWLLPRPIDGEGRTYGYACTRAHLQRLAERLVRWQGRPVRPALPGFRLDDVLRDARAGLVTPPAVVELLAQELIARRERAREAA